MASVDKALLFSVKHLKRLKNPRKLATRSSQRRPKLEEQKWQEFFEKPAMWIDNRSNKKHSEDPDFVHIFTWEGLWIDSCCCPKWVALKLRRLDDDGAVTDGGSGFKLKGRQSIEYFDKLREDGSPASNSVILSVLKACSSLKDLESGARVHAYVREKDLAENLFVSSALADMYTKCGELVAARRVFDRMRHRDVVVWNTLIRGYAQSGEQEQALALFRRMQEHEGIQPDARTFVAALGACAGAAQKLKDESRRAWLDKGREIHLQLVKMDLEQDIYLASALVDMYSKCGSMVEARRVFENRRKRGGVDVVLWTAIILGYSQSHARTALELFDEMRGSGVVEPNARTYVAALSACSNWAAEDEVPGTKHVCLEKGKMIHDELSQHGYEHDSFVASNLVDMYCKCRLMTDARRVFDEMQRKDVISWTTVIQGYSEAGEAKAALELYWRIQQEEHQLRPNSKTIVAALNTCSTLAAFNQSDAETIEWCLKNGLGVHQQACQQGDESEVYVGSSLVDMYCKCGRVNEASRVFQVMVKPDLISFTALIAGMAHTADQARQAVQLFDQMLLTSDPLHQPNAATCAAALRACAALPSRLAGARVLSFAIRAGLECHAAVMCAAVDWRGKCGDAKSAELAFEGGDAATWSALIGAYARQGDARGAVRALRRMTAEDVEGDAVTCVTVVSACGHAGMVEEAKEVVETMVKRKLTLKWRREEVEQVYGCLVDVLGRANRLEEAAAIAEGESSGWLAVLDASRKWGDVKMATTSFQELMRLDHRIPAAYSLMAEALVSKASSV